MQRHRAPQSNSPRFAALRCGSGSWRPSLNAVVYSHPDRAHGKTKYGELASSLVIDRSDLAHNLKPLERDGLVEIVVDQDDKRTRLATLTAAGRIKLTRAMPLWESAQRCFEAVFGAKNAVKLRASLKLIASPAFVQDFQRAGIRVGRSGRRPDTLYSTSALRVK
jgi:DNA-binding MarR family transcriptional regulator